MGFFAGLNAEKYDREYSDRELLGRIGDYLKPQWKRLGGIAVMVLALSATGAAQPVIVSRGVDLLKDRPTLEAILAISAVVLTVGLFGWLANYVRRRLTTRTIADVLLNLGTDAFRASALHDLSFYDTFSSGRIQSRITTDTRDFGNLVVLTTDLVSQVTEAAILAVVLFRIEPRLSIYLF